MFLVIFPPQKKEEKKKHDQWRLFLHQCIVRNYWNPGSQRNQKSSPWIWSILSIVYTGATLSYHDRWKHPSRLLLNQSSVVWLLFLKEFSVKYRKVFSRVLSCRSWLWLLAFLKYKDTFILTSISYVWDYFHHYFTNKSYSKPTITCVLDRVRFSGSRLLASLSHLVHQTQSIHQPKAFKVAVLSQIITETLKYLLMVCASASRPIH